MLTNGGIRVDGIRDLNRKLRAVDKDAPKKLRLAGNKAAEVVVTVSQRELPTGPAAGGHARSSYRAASTRTAARVKAGGKKFPYVPWLEFGGRVGRQKATKRRFVQTGRYMYPAYYDNREQIKNIMTRELRDAASPLDPH